MLKVLGSDIFSYGLKVRAAPPIRTKLALKEKMVGDMRRIILYFSGWIRDRHIIEDEKKRQLATEQCIAMPRIWG